MYNRTVIDVQQKCNRRIITLVVQRIVHLTGVQWAGVRLFFRFFSYDRVWPCSGIDLAS